MHLCVHIQPHKTEQDIRMYEFKYAMDRNIPYFGKEKCNVLF